MYETLIACFTDMMRLITEVPHYLSCPTLSPCKKVKTEGRLNITCISAFIKLPVYIAWQVLSKYWSNKDAGFLQRFVS